MANLIDYLSEKYKPESIDEINRRLLELSSLFEISQTLNESLDLSHVLNNVLLIPMGRMMIARGAIILRENNCFRIHLSKGLSKNLEEKAITVSDIPHQAFKISDLKERDDIYSVSLFAADAKLELGIPFISHNRCLGIALFGPKLNKTDFSKDEKDFLNSLASIATSSIENALQLKKTQEINRQLDERIQELKTLFDIGQGLAATLEYSKILRLLTYAFMGQMLITHYSILLKQDDELHIQENKGFSEGLIESIAQRLLKISTPETAVVTEDLSDTKLVEILSKNDIKVLIPLTHQDKLLGYILLGARISNQKYGTNDLEFLTTLVSQAVISLENARLFQETLEKQRLEEELNVARKIQKNLLPKSLPVIEFYDIYGINISSKQVGGDYYDVIPLDVDRYIFAIGDVSGKSVPAALLMANLQAGLRVMVNQSIPLPEIVSNLNNLIYNNTDPDKYITFFIGILDVKKNVFEYINAGHNPPILCDHDGKMEILDVGGIILGMMPNFSYPSAHIELQKNDFILTYTDGINEAIDPSDAREEEYGEERLRKVILKTRERSTRDLANAVLEDIREFTRNNLDSDDVTMLVLKRID
jgi:sigma-B regulation protein RsbU (phosphoserine phosphatase)